jgi:hypothetical protein
LRKTKVLLKRIAKNSLLCRDQEEAGCKEVYTELLNYIK